MNQHRFGPMTGNPLQYGVRPRVAPLWLLLIGLGVILDLGLIGCKDSEEHRSLVAANERLVDLKKENTRLEQQLKTLQTRLTEREAALNQQHDASLMSLKEEMGDRQSQRSQLHNARTAELETTIASQRTELGALGRERLLLQGILDRKPRIEGARKTRCGMIEVILALLGGLVLMVLVLVAARHRVLRRNQDQVLIVRAASVARTQGE